jgi:glycosyltransferase involved in cell wall biosynthesis
MEPTRLWLASARHFAKACVLGRRQGYNAIRRAAEVVTITEADADAVRKIYRLEKSRIHVVPNGVNEGFFSYSPSLWQEKFGAKPFVLSVGAIQKRKNQLLLLEACNELCLPVVLLGPVLPGEKDYARRVASAAKKNEALGGRWLQSLQSDDPLLFSAFAACRLFCLFSTSETQPLSVLQAMAARKPILLSRASYTKDSPFSELPTIGSNDRKALNQALEKTWSLGNPASLSRNHTWHQIARRLKAVYETALLKAAARSDFTT